MENEELPSENSSLKNHFWLFGIGFFFLIYGLNICYLSSKNTKVIAYSEFLEKIDNGSINRVLLEGDRIFGESGRGEKTSDSKYVAIAPKDDLLISKLLQKGVRIEAEESHPLMTFLLTWMLPIGFLIFFWFSFLGKFAGRSSGLLSLTKSRFRTNREKNVKTSFADVAGIDEAKEELWEIVSFLQDPKSYTRLGGRSPKGVLLVGPPGTGKTLLARAVAGEAKVSFFSINGSEFVEMFVGLGAARVRDLFEQARREAPCILFIDEIDSLGKARTLGIAGSGSSDEKEQTLNQLLAEMDGFDTSEGVVILAATNRPEILDPALLRAGRFDRQIILYNPDHAGRLQILKVHARKIKVDENVDLVKVASMTSGFSGADLANLVNEAAIMATRRSADSVAEKDFSNAIERLVAGPEKKTKLMSVQEKRRIAIHELGHAVVGLSLRTPEKIQKISIIPRGSHALGYTLQRPLSDRYLFDQTELLNKICVLLGGRAAEQMNLPTISTGAADDLVKASDLARAMVVQFGMSQKMGLVSFDLKRTPFWSGEVDIQIPRVSEGTIREIDLEVKAILEDCFATAKSLMIQKKDFIDLATKQLLESETLDETQIYDLWQNMESSNSGKNTRSLEVPLDV